MMQEPIRVMFVCLGRRGAACQFTLQVARTVVRDPRYVPTICVSRHNESIAELEEFRSHLFVIETFNAEIGAITRSWRIPKLRRQLHERIRKDRTQVVIELMPHVWSPFVMPVIRETGASYCTIIHDADAHPGDRTGWVNSLLHRTIRAADLTVALSDAVARKLVASGKVDRDKIETLFHPDFAYGQPFERPLVPRKPVRLLFLGRIISYKGLPLFLDAVDLLKNAGVPVQVGIFGEGLLGADAERIRDLGAEVVNRWLAEHEIADALSRYDVVVLSHIEASQSGVAASAFGAGVPVVATPVGGLPEQVKDGKTGVLAARVDAPALAEAVKRLVSEPGLYNRICENLRSFQSERSVEKFVEACIGLALRRSPATSSCLGRCSRI